MRPRGSAAVLEARRPQALALLKEGQSLQAVARWLRCAASSVMRWRDAVRRRGARGFQVGASPGRPPKLTKQQRKQLVRLLLQGSLAHGYRTDVWTTPRVAEDDTCSPRLTVLVDHLERGATPICGEGSVGRNSAKRALPYFLMP